ncbi:MlaD family protein [Bacteroidota bacterium]
MKISKEFKIGVFGIICITLLYLGFNYLKGKDFFSSSNRYYAIYSNIDGLTVSNSIYINGLSVGRVSNIIFMQNMENQILVEIDIDDNITLDESAVAILISEGFLGGKAIKLEIPDEIENPIEPGDTLKSTVDVGILESITERTLPVADDLGTTIKMLNSILENFQGTELELKEAMIELRKTIISYRMLAVKNQEDINAMMASLSSMAMNLDSASEELKPLLANANTFMDSLNTLRINELMQTAHSTFQNLDTLLANLNEGEGTAGKLLHDDSLYFYLTRTAEDLDKLLVDFKENPGRYVQVSVFGKKDKSEKK